MRNSKHGKLAMSDMQALQVHMRRFSEKFTDHESGTVIWADEKTLLFLQRKLGIQALVICLNLPEAEWHWYKYLHDPNPRSYPDKKYVFLLKTSDHYNLLVHREASARSAYFYDVLTFTADSAKGLLVRRTSRAVHSI